MARRRDMHRGKITDYSGSDMVDPKTRRAALDDYIGRTGWKMSQVQRSELVDAACRIADVQIATQCKQAEPGRSAGPAARLSAPGESSQAEPLTWRTAWKAWV